MSGSVWSVPRCVFAESAADGQAPLVRGVPGAYNMGEICDKASRQVSKRLSSANSVRSR